MSLSSIAGYAMSRVKRARGQNKWVNNPKPQDLRQASALLGTLTRSWQERQR